jgi:hypothetical protein
MSAVQCERHSNRQDSWSVWDASDFVSKLTGRVRENCSLVFHIGEQRQSIGSAINDCTFGFVVLALIASV